MGQKEESMNTKTKTEPALIELLAGRFRVSGIVSVTPPFEDGQPAKPSARLELNVMNPDGSIDLYLLYSADLSGYLIGQGAVKPTIGEEFDLSIGDPGYTASEDRLPPARLPTSVPEPAAVRCSTCQELPVAGANTGRGDEARYLMMCPKCHDFSPWVRSYEEAVSSWNRGERMGMVKVSAASDVSAEALESGAACTCEAGDSLSDGPHHAKECPRYLPF
jgi:hypothetical protein